jgi:hypothetical protein
MKILKYILMTLFVMGMFTGCPLDDDNSLQTNLTDDVNDTSDSEVNQDTTQFSLDLKSVLAQAEDDEPLEITDTVDDSTSFDSLL